MLMFTDHDRHQDHEAIRQLQDIMHRHIMHLSCADLTVFNTAVDAIRNLEHRLDDHPILGHVTTEQAWWQGDTAQLEGLHLSDNPYPLSDERHKAWAFGFRSIPANFGRAA